MPFYPKPTLMPIDETGYRTIWLVTRPFVYVSEKYSCQVHVPRGFKTDLASVPRFPLSWWIAGGIGNSAAVVHDYLVTKSVQGKSKASVFLCGEDVRKTPRYIADGIFYEAMLDTGVPRWRAYLMWLATRAKSLLLR